jgi:hypothetical protein
MTTPLSATVANLRRLLKDAPPGPLTHHHAREDFSKDPEEHDFVMEAGGSVMADCGTSDFGQSAKDAALIVAAVNALPTLLDAVEERDRLRDDNARLVLTLLRADKGEEAWQRTLAEMRQSSERPYAGKPLTLEQVKERLGITGSDREIAERRVREAQRSLASAEVALAALTEVDPHA